MFRYFAIKDEDGSVRAGHINSRLIDGFREISLRTELSTRVLRPQLSLVRPCIQDFVASYRSHFGLTPTQRYSPMKPRCRWRTPSAEQDPTSRPQSNGHSRQRLCNRCLAAATHLTTTTTPTLTRASAPPIDASEVNAPCGAYRSANEVMTKCSAAAPAWPYNEVWVGSRLSHVSEVLGGARRNKFQRRMRNERPGVVWGPRRKPATRRMGNLRQLRCGIYVRPKQRKMVLKELPRVRAGYGQRCVSPAI